MPAGTRKSNTLTLSCVLKTPSFPSTSDELTLQEQKHKQVLNEFTKADVVKGIFENLFQILKQQHKLR
jgi:hypothetical protein